MIKAAPIWDRIAHGSIQADRIEAGVIEDPDGELERLTQDLIDDLRAFDQPDK